MEVKGTESEDQSGGQGRDGTVMVIRSRTMAKLKTPESPGETGDVIPGLRSSAKGC